MAMCFVSGLLCFGVECQWKKIYQWPQLASIIAPCHMILA